MTHKIPTIKDLKLGKYSDRAIAKAKFKEALKDAQSSNRGNKSGLSLHSRNSGSRLSVHKRSRHLTLGQSSSKKTVEFDLTQKEREDSQSGSPGFKTYVDKSMKE